MANITTIPKKHYVTIQYRKDVTSESSHLGFASPYTKDAAFRKRKETQDRWAYGYGTTVNIDENDDITVIGGGYLGGHGNMEVDASTLFITNCYPIIINNDPIEGFQIAKSVRRYGSWGSGGNVVWRIADPRGFEVEISSSNFAAALGCTTMINGVIQGKCVWGRCGKDNILLPQASDVYQEANKITAKIAKNISLKDVKVGDTVELLNKGREEGSYQYLGKHFFLVTTQAQDDTTGHSGIFSFNEKQLERYLFKEIVSGNYITLITPKILAVVEAIENPLDKMKIAKEATAWLNRDNRMSDVSETILLSPIKIKPEEITTQLVPLGETINGEWPKVDRYHTDPIIAEFDGEFWLAGGHREWDYSIGSYNSTPYLEKLDVNTTQNKITLISSLKKSGSYYNSYLQREYVIRKDFTFDQLKMYRIEVTANGITGKVYRLGY